MPRVGGATFAKLDSVPAAMSVASASVMGSLFAAASVAVATAARGCGMQPQLRYRVWQLCSFRSRLRQLCSRAS